MARGLYMSFAGCLAVWLHHPALAATPDTLASVVPCMQRYSQQVIYALTPQDIGMDAEQLVARWGIRKSPWGIERVSVVEAPGLKESALQILFPAGSVNPSNKEAPKGGAVLYIDSASGQDAEAACLHYRVYFPADFQFAKGGKLPGLYGGRNGDGKSAAGCRKGVENDGFSTRYMWREGGAGSIYAYLPGKTEKCGSYIGRGSWHFTPGTWTTLEQEVILDHEGKQDGIIRVWADGRLVINETGLAIRPKAKGKIDGIFFASFFGGKGPEWASPRTQMIYITDLKIGFAK